MNAMHIKAPRVYIRTGIYFHWGDSVFIVRLKITLTSFGLDWFIVVFICDHLIPLEPRRCDHALKDDFFFKKVKKNGVLSSNRTEQYNNAQTFCKNVKQVYTTCTD